MFKRLTYYLKTHIPILRSLPKPGAPFDADRFLQLLVSSIDGDLSREEIEYIKREIKRNPEARKMYRNTRETYPRARGLLIFADPPRRSLHAQLKIAAIILVLVICVGGCMYALTRRYWYIAPVKEKKGYNMSDKSLQEIANMITKYYNVSVVFDNSKLAGRRFVGEFDTTKSLTDFLDDLTNTNEVHCYFDKEHNILHFK